MNERLTPSSSNEHLKAIAYKFLRDEIEALGKLDQLESLLRHAIAVPEAKASVLTAQTGEDYLSLYHSIEALAAANDCTFEQMRQLLIAEVQETKRGSGPVSMPGQSSDRPEPDSADQTGQWEVPADSDRISGLSPEEYIKGEIGTDRTKREMMATILSMDLLDGNMIMQYAAAYPTTEQRKAFLGMVADVRRLGPYDATKHELRRTLKEVVEKLKAHGISTDDEDLESDGARTTREFGPGVADFINSTREKQMENEIAAARQAVAKTTQPAGSPAVINKQENEVYNQAVIMPEGVVLRPDMSVADFHSSLTDHGRWMLQKLADLGEDMMDGTKVSALEKKHQLKGFLLLATYFTGLNGSLTSNLDTLKADLETKETGNGAFSAKTRSMVASEKSPWATPPAKPPVPIAKVPVEQIPVEVDTNMAFHPDSAKIDAKVMDKIARFSQSKGVDSDGRGNFSAQAVSKLEVSEPETPALELAQKADDVDDFVHKLSPNQLLDLDSYLEVPLQNDHTKGVKIAVPERKGAWHIAMAVEQLKQRFDCTDVYMRSLLNRARKNLHEPRVILEGQPKKSPILPRTVLSKNRRKKPAPPRPALYGKTSKKG